jgi:hypothetical protein
VASAVDVISTIGSTPFVATAMSLRAMHSFQKLAMHAMSHLWPPRETLLIAHPTDEEAATATGA